MEETVSKINSLLQKGNFYPSSIQATLLGKDIEQMTEKDLESWNSIQLNVTFHLKKIPGKEVVEKKTSLVNSEIMQGENEIAKGINDFLVSRINNIIGEMSSQNQNQEEKENLKKIQGQLEKNLLNDPELKQQIDMYYSNLIQQNKDEDNDAFAQNYIDNLCIDIVQNVKKSVVESIVKKNPNVDQKALEQFVEENIAEKQKNIKNSALRVYDEFKTRINEHDGDDLNQFVQKYMQQTINTLEVSALQQTKVKNEALDEALQQQVQEGVGKLLAENISKNQQNFNKSYINLMKSAYYQGIVAETIQKHGK